MPRDYLPFRQHHFVWRSQLMYQWYSVHIFVLAPKIVVGQYCGTECYLL